MPDPTIETLAQAMKAQNKRNADLARVLGIDSSQVNRLFNGRRKLQLHEARLVDGWLGTNLTGGAQPVAATVVPGPGMIPLYGWVAEGGALHIGEECLIGYTGRHPAQSNSRDAFAVQISDDTMAPRYEPGEIAFVAPNQFPARYQDGLVVPLEGSAFVARFLNRTTLHVSVTTLDDTPQRDLLRSGLDGVHAIVGRG